MLEFSLQNKCRGEAIMLKCPCKKAIVIEGRTALCQQLSCLLTKNDTAAIKTGFRAV
jgi:hypothetical protein